MKCQRTLDFISRNGLEINVFDVKIIKNIEVFMSNNKVNEKLTIRDRMIEIISIICLMLPVSGFLYYVNYYSNDRMMSIINEETTVFSNKSLTTIKEGVYLTTSQDIEKRGSLIDHKSVVYKSDNQKYTTILNEKIIIRFKYSKSAKNKLFETVSFLTMHKTTDSCQQSIEKTSRYFLNKTNVFMYPDYTKTAIVGGYSYHYEGFVGIDVPTMEFYCKDTMEIAKINIIKEHFFENYTLD